MLTAAPVYLTWAARGVPMLPRLAQAGVDAACPVTAGERLRDVLGLLVAPVASDWFYGGALLLPVLALLVVPGAWAAPRRPGGRVLLLWVGLAFAGQMALCDVWSARVALTFPAFAVLAALGWDRVWKGIDRAARHRTVFSRRLFLRITRCSLLLALLAAQAGYYFAVRLPEYNTQFRLSYDVDDALRRAVLLPPGTQAYLITDAIVDRFNVDTVWRFWGKPDLSITVLYPAYLTDALLASQPRAQTYAFFIAPDDAATRAFLEARFLLLPAQGSPFPVPQAYQFVLYVGVRAAG